MANKIVTNYADHSTLEELAVHRLQTLPKGSGFWGYAEIVRKVINVQKAEDAAARLRAKTIADLTPGYLEDEIAP